MATKDEARNIAIARSELGAALAEGIGQDRLTLWLPYDCGLKPSDGSTITTTYDMRVRQPLLVIDCTASDN